MRTWPTSRGGLCAAPGRRYRARRNGVCKRHPPGFTMIELMVVIGVMGIILAMGIPSILKIWRKEGMRKATSDIVEVCSNARAQAILRGAPVVVVFHPMDKRFEITGGSSAPQPDASGEMPAERPAVTPAAGRAGQFGDDIWIEMLDINLLEYRESEWAKVRFFPNGTSDELTLILRSSRNEWKKITLEVTTGLASVDDVR